MLTAMIGRKLGMTQVFQENGKCIPVTVIEAGPCTVTQVKMKAHDGYDAVQLGYEPVSIQRLRRPLRGHLSKAKKGGFRVLREVRLPDDGSSVGVELGLEVCADIFSDSKKIDVVGVSKGKGFQGVIKRHGFAGGVATHGSMFHRAPGSIGSGTDPARVWKGQRLPGRTGGERMTQLNLEVIKVVPEKNILLVKGAVPGPLGGLLMIRKARKGGA